jgi:hypothetical protein
MERLVPALEELALQGAVIHPTHQIEGTRTDLYIVLVVLALSRTIRSSLEDLVLPLRLACLSVDRRRK